MSQRKDGGRPGRAGLSWGSIAAVALVSCLIANTARAGQRSPYQAHAGVDLAGAAARVWSADAALVYVENDENVGDDGAAQRWGYLFYSSALKKCRAYSIRGGAILVAEDLDMKFEAPPVSSGWIDSGAALAAALQAGGREFLALPNASVSTMLLSRGAFSADDPDETTWTVVYSSPNAPSLFVLVDAAQGKVRRTWRG